MAILGTVTKAMIDAYSVRGVKFYINGIYSADGATYKTDDIITFFSSDGKKLLNNLLVVGSDDIEYLTTARIFKISEIRLTGTTPFVLDFTTTFNDVSETIYIDTQNIAESIAKGVSFYYDGVRTYSVGILYVGGTLALKADETHIITIARLFASTGNANNKDFTITDGGKTATIQFTTFGFGTRFLQLTTKIGDIVIPEPDMLITQNDLDSFTNQKGILRIGSYSSANSKVGDKYVKNSTIRYIVDVDFYDVGSVVLNDGNVSFLRFGTSNDFYLPYPYDYSDGGLDITVTGSDVVYYVFQSDIDYCNDNNSKLYVNGVLATAQTPLNVDDEIKVIANVGFEYFYDDGYSSVYSSNLNDWLPLSDGNKVAKFNIQNIARKLGFSIDTIAVQPDAIQGVNNVYSLTKSQVKTFISTDWIEELPSGDIDHNKEIISLLELPFLLPQSLILGDESVRLGVYNTNVVAVALNDDQMVIDLGVIDVPMVKNNLLDYKDTTTVLNLPYVEKMFLETNDVIGQQISINYVINLYNSMMTVNVSSSKSGKIIISKTVDLNFQIPFGDVTTRPKGSDATDVSLVKNNGVKTAFVEVIRNDVLLENGLFTIPIVDELLLNDVRGYVEIENVDLKVTGNSDDKNDIKTILQNGVIIND